MTRSLKALAAALLLIAPGLPRAQEPSLTVRIDSISEICLSAADPECETIVAALIRDLQAQEDYIGNLTRLAANLANAADPALPLLVLQTLSRALVLVAEASPALELQARILDLASLIRTGDSIMLEADRLLASPN
ncbi:MAG: hypothetical protein L3J37_04365 [Rhodobacteraceae bacterium]|nr:hypothetical protein [Paracoccaceae bacterium]